MAVEFETNGAAPGPAYEAPGSARPHSAFWLAGQLSRGAVTQNIIDYLTRVDEELKRLLSGILRRDVKVHRVELPDPTGAQGYWVEAPAKRGSKDMVKVGSIVIFADILTPYESHLPTSMRAAPAMSSMRAEVGRDLSFLNTYVIRDEDLNRAEKMAACLAMDFVPMIEPTLNIPLIDMGADGMEFSIDTRMDSVHSMIDRLSPHATNPRVDMGFVVSMRMPRDRNFTVSGQSLSDQSVQFLVVGAYTEILGAYPDAQGRKKFVPAIRRPVVYSSIPSLASIILADVLSAEYFIRREMWKRHFMKFSKGSPNLGQLLPDPNNPAELWFAPDDNMLRNFLQENVTQPMLVTEVVEGHYRIPDISLFSGLPEDSHEILTAAAHMFNSAVPVGAPSPVTAIGVEYVGTFGSNGGLKQDTRVVTYLDEVAKRGMLDDATKSILTNYTMQPFNKADVVARLIGSPTFLHQTTLAALNPEYVSWLARMVPSSVRLVDQDGGYSSFTPLGSFMDTYTNYANFSSVMYHNQQRTQFGVGSYAHRSWV